MVAISLNSRWSRLVLAIVAFAVPLIGVLGLNWSVLAMLFISGVETGVYLLRSSFESLFATRETTRSSYSPLPLEHLLKKRGHLTVSDRLPPVYPRNVPFALSHLGVLGGLAILIGMVIVTRYVPVPGTLDTTVGVAAVAVLVRQVAATIHFFRTEGYVDQSAGSIINRRPLAAGALFLLFLLLASGGGKRGVTAAFLAALVAKLCYDVVDAWTDGEYFQSTRESLIGEDTDVDVPDGDPRFVAETAPEGVLVKGLIIGVLSPLLLPVGFVVLLSGIAAFGPVIGVATLLALIAARALAEIPIARLQYGAIEYRVYHSTIVAYDCQLEAPQWQVPRYEIRDVYSRTAVTSRFFSRPFGKVKLKRDDGPQKRLLAVARPDRVANRL